MDILNMEYSIQISNAHWKEMLSDVSSPGNHEERCGLLAGHENKSVFVFPATNILHSPHQFQIDPLEQLNFFKILDQNKWDLLAIYHSHPNGYSSPSEKDIDEAFYPDAVNLIWFVQNSEWYCLAYRIIGKLVFNVRITLLNE
jgi:proteasome lid subunit RPN8/RPN11